MIKTTPIRLTRDLVEAVDLLEKVAVREGYRLVATHPLFKYAFEAGFEDAPKAVSLDFDAPRLAHLWPALSPKAAWLLPVRLSIAPEKGRLVLLSPDPEAVRPLLGALEGDTQKAWAWFEVTQEIVTAYMTGRA